MSDNISIPPYVSVSGRARWVTILFIATIILALYAIISTYFQINLLNDIAAGKEVTMEQAQANDSKMQTIMIIHIILFIITGIFFLIWFYRAHKNLQALGAQQLEFTPGWAVGWFFIPIFFFFKPYQAAQEIWRASDPNAADKSSWRTLPSSSLVLLWWLLFVLSNLIARYSNSLAHHAGDKIPELINVSWIVLIAISIEILSAITAIFVVKAITARQEEKYKKVVLLNVQEESPQISKMFGS